MSQLGSSGSSSSALTAQEWAVACYFADAECERKRPRNRDAYRATVLRRKCDEIVATRGIVTQVDEFHTTRRIIDTAPVDDWAPPIDPLLARQLREKAMAEGRAELGQIPQQRPSQAWSQL